MSKLSVRASGSIRWVRAWPDALAFAGGLILAWFGKWDATDLVWSLWLSSLMIGYGKIILSFLGPLVIRQREGRLGVNRAEVLVGLFLALFTIGHFSGMHLIVARCLGGFFPVDPMAKTLFDWRLFAEVIARYWYFVPLTVIAERKTFRSGMLARIFAVKAAGSQAPKTFASWPSPGEGFIEPYLSVMGLNLMLWFLALAHIVRLETFTVYATVYALYFFPWRLLFDPAVQKNYLASDQG